MNMVVRLRSAAFLIAIAGLAACAEPTGVHAPIAGADAPLFAKGAGGGGGGGGGGAVVPAPGPLSGGWVMTYHSYATDADSNGSLFLTQTGNTLAGTFLWSPEVGDASVYDGSGSVTGSTFFFSMRRNGRTTTPATVILGTLSADSTSVTGYLELSGSGTRTGTVVLTRG
jgi:hypothetical protein